MQGTNCGTRHHDDHNRQWLRSLTAQQTIDPAGRYKGFPRVAAPIPPPRSTSHMSSGFRMFVRLASAWLSQGFRLLSHHSKSELDRPARHKTLHWAESAHPPKRRCPSQTLSSPAKGGKENTPSATRSPKCTYINIFGDETYFTLSFVSYSGC